MKQNQLSLLEEVQLIQESRNGNPEAFSKLIHTFYPKIYQMLQQLTFHPQEAEDLTQETFLEAYRCLKNFKGLSRFYTWLYQIAVNLAMNHLKRKKKMPLSLENHKIYPAKHKSTPIQRLEWQEFENDLWKAIQQLSPEKRLVFILREMHQLSYQEIAQVANINIGTVMSRLSRAREDLRTILQHHRT